MLKRIALLFVAAALFAGAALAEGPLCVCAHGVTALIDAMGNEILPNGAFERIFTVREGALYAAGRRGDYRLYDAAGNALGDERFAMICDEGDALIYRVGGLYGAMRADGSVLVEPEWTQLTGDGAGGWLALGGDPLDDRADEIIHLDAAGDAKKTGVYTAAGLQPVRCDRMPYMDRSGRCGAVNGRGEAVVEAAWASIGAYRDGLARAAGESGVGLIDVVGNAVVPAVYDWLERGPAMIVAQAGNRVDVFSTDGAQKRFSVDGEKVEACLVGSCLSLDVDDMNLLYGPDGTLLSADAKGTRYREGLAGQLIAGDGAWGEACEWLVDPDGSAASGRFQQLLPLCAGRYAFMEMDGVEYYSKELDALQRTWNYAGMRYGLMDASGTPLLPARYVEILPLGGERMLLVTEDSVQLADVNGEVLRAWPVTESAAPTAEEDA